MWMVDGVDERHSLEQVSSELGCILETPGITHHCFLGIQFLVPGDPSLAYEGSSEQFVIRHPTEPEALADR